MGAHHAPAVPYDRDYWEKYQEYDRGPMGSDLTAARCAVVRTYVGPLLSEVVDVGIGGGRFVREAGCYGDDINPHALDWLERQGARRDHTAGAPVLTFWDSLEHMEDPAAALACAREWAFVSLPVFSHGDAIPTSKHYRPGEHFWYWTHAGFVAFANRCGFRVVNSTDIETRLGREDIKTYALQRAAL